MAINVQKWPRTRKYLLFNHTKDRNWKLPHRTCLECSYQKVSLRDFMKVSLTFFERFFNKSGRCSIHRHSLLLPPHSLTHRLKEFIQKCLLSFHSDWKHFRFFLLFPRKSVFHEKFLSLRGNRRASCKFTISKYFNKIRSISRNWMEKSPFDRCEPDGREFTSSVTSEISRKRGGKFKWAKTFSACGEPKFS